MAAAKYEIELLTLKGPVTVIYDSSQGTLEKFEKEMLEKYGTFVTLNSKQL